MSQPFIASESPTLNTKITNIVTSFEGFNTYPDIMETTKIMEELNNIVLTPQEYAGYLPFYEEVADIALRNVSNIDN